MLQSQSSVLYTINFISKYHLTVFSLGMVFFKFLYLLDNVVFLHLFLLNLRYHFRNGVLFLFQQCFFLFQVWGTNIASVQVRFHINNEASEASLEPFVPNKYGPILCVRKRGIIQENNFSAGTKIQTVRAMGPIPITS